jgi:hypothetical protein
MSFHVAAVSNSHYLCIAHYLRIAYMAYLQGEGPQWVDLADCRYLRVCMGFDVVSLDKEADRGTATCVGRVDVE